MFAKSVNSKSRAAKFSKECLPIFGPLFPILLPSAFSSLIASNSMVTVLGSSSPLSFPKPMLNLPDLPCCLMQRVLVLFSLPIVAQLVLDPAIFCPFLASMQRTPEVQNTKRKSSLDAHVQKQILSFSNVIHQFIQLDNVYPLS